MSQLLQAIAQCTSTVNFAGGNICETISWKLVFHDEFNGNSIDQNKWTTYYPYGNISTCEFCRTHGNEGQIYLDDHVIVSNGTLKLIANYQPTTWISAYRNFASGMIHSKSHYAFMYGKFEIKCKIPSGNGLWPAFWGFGGNGTEIDVFEFCGESPNNHTMNVRKWSNNSVIADLPYDYNGVDFSTGFHVYSVEWDKFFLTFRVDGTQVYRIPRYIRIGDTAPVTWCDVLPGVYIQRPAYPCGLNNNINIIANLALDGLCSTPSISMSQKQMEIEYIRVYQRTPQAGFIDLCGSGTINGNSLLCNSTTTTYNYTGPNSSVGWSVSSNLMIISSTSMSVTVQPVNNMVNGTGWVTANFAANEPCPSSSATKSIWIGKPNTPVVKTTVANCDNCFHITAYSNPLSVPTYRWNIGNHQYNTIDCSNTYPFSIPYTVTVSNQCGSKLKSGYIISHCVGNKSKSLVISPNSATDSIKIELKGIGLDSVEKFLLVSDSLNYYQDILISDSIFYVDASSFKDGPYYAILNFNNVAESIKEEFRIDHSIRDGEHNPRRIVIDPDTVSVTLNLSLFNMHINVIDNFLLVSEENDYYQEISVDTLNFQIDVSSLNEGNYFTIVNFIDSVEPIFQKVRIKHLQVDPENSSLIITLTPNPASNTVQVELPDINLSEIESFSLLSLMTSASYYFPVSGQTFQINISTLDKGLYFGILRFTDNSSPVVELLIIKRD